MNALFFRKCKSFEDLVRAYKKYPDFGQVLDYKIIKIIELEQTEYELFIGNFLKEYSYIDSAKNEMHMDNNDCVHCILIKFQNEKEIIVYSAGYSYAKYVALH